MLKDTILYLLEREEKLKNEPTTKEDALPEKCYFLDEDTILCYPRTTGDSRYPYVSDGFTLWAYSSGYISLNESTFYYILPASEGKEPYCAFFGGIKNGEGGYTPVSITGVARQAKEAVNRFTVYTPQAVYYIAKTKQTAFFVRAFVSPAKQAIFTVGALDLSGKKTEIYLSTFLNCLLMHQACENVETKWFKQCKVTPHGFTFESVEDLDRTTHLINFGVINRRVDGEVLYAEHTASRSDYAGGANNSLHIAPALFTGHFEKRAEICQFSDTAAAGDLYTLSLPSDGFAAIDYVAEAHFDRTEANNAVRAIENGFADRLIDEAIVQENKKKASPTAMRIEFGDFATDELNGSTLTKFIHNVQRQTEFAALAKNSGVSLLGVRDVVQQIEAALMWAPLSCRAKFLELFNFIDPCGRPPRQYSLPAKGALPQTDTRAFIDQGVWIVSAIYTYLSFTDDYSILDEVCGYYKIVGRNKVEAVAERNSVGEHLCRIMDYLIDNIDEKTHCLRALYGDWNDALDGLGVAKDPDREFGSGVSVMASLQLYKNLGEMLDILSHYGDKFAQAERYQRVKAELKDGLQKYAVVEKDGKRKILHGWGDERSYLVGSFSDVDGESRDGLTANAFWVISGAYLWDKTIKKDILESFSRLDSKYGMKTFEPYFKPGTKGVGRIVNLPKGTAENAATYVHATLFGIAALFRAGEGEKAWEQLKKVLPLTHAMISTTPFIMSNSYSYNEELLLDGGSMSDWFTGSANTLLKTLVWQFFGILPNLDGVKLSPSAYFPFATASICLSIKGKKITVNYSKPCGEKRTFRFNGKELPVYADESSSAPTVYIRTEELLPVNKIEIF